MRGQAGFWDIDERYVRLSEAGDPLEKLNAVVPWEVFRKPLGKALKRSDGAKGGRPPYDPVMMFKIMVFGHADLRPGAGDADGAHEQAHPGFQLREDVFDEGAGFRSPPIGPRRRLAHRPTLRFLLVDVRDVAVLLQPLLVLFRAIGRVGPDSRTGVGALEDIAKLRAVIGRRARDVPAADVTLPTISPASSGTRGELRPHNGEGGETADATPKSISHPPRQGARFGQPRPFVRLPFKNRGKSICPIARSHGVRLYFAGCCGLRFSQALRMRSETNEVNRGVVAALPF